MALTNNAIYVGGKKSAEPESLRETYGIMREGRGGIAWIGLNDPTEEEFASVAEEFDLHGLAVEDAINAHQRPKLERYGDTLFVVLRPARYVDERENVSFSEVHVFVGENFVITSRHGDSPDISEVKRHVEERPELLTHGPEAILYALLDEVVDNYNPVVEGLGNDIDEIEEEVFGGNPNVSRRVYALSREVIEFQRAARPLRGMLDDLTAGFEKYGIDKELRRYLRDVQDHVVYVCEQIEGFRQILQNILSVSLTLVSVQQNDEVKKISAWAAILFAPTLVGTVYGMNFDDIPELHWQLGYPFALALMLLISLILFGVFKNRGWL